MIFSLILIENNYFLNKKTPHFNLMFMNTLHVPVTHLNISCLCIIYK